MVGESRPLYEHVLLCTRKSANPDLGISPTRANGLTYKRALLYKRMVYFFFAIIMIIKYTYKNKTHL